MKLGKLKTQVKKHPHGRQLLKINNPTKNCSRQLSKFLKISNFFSFFFIFYSAEYDKSLENNVLSLTPPLKTLLYTPLRTSIELFAEWTRRAPCPP